LLSYTLTSWSKNKKLIVLQANEEDDWDQVYVSNLDGTNIVKITKPGADYQSPTLSPEGQFVAFKRKNDIDDWDQTDLLMAGIDGYDQNNLTNGSVLGIIDPAWAPFGDWIAFAGKSERGDYDLYLIKADGTNLMHIDTGPLDDVNPAWRTLGR
jgi:TolB protein